MIFNSFFLIIEALNTKPNVRLHLNRLGFVNWGIEISQLFVII